MTRPRPSNLDSGRTKRSTADSLNVTVKNGRLDIRSKFFSERTCAQWNAVPSAAASLQIQDRIQAIKREYTGSVSCPAAVHAR